MTNIFTRPFPSSADAGWRAALRCRRWFLGVLLCGLCLTSNIGCSSTRYIAKREEPFNPVVETWNLFAGADPTPTERTLKLLRTYDIEKIDPEERLTHLDEEIAADPTPEKLYAYAELAYLAGKRAEDLGKDARAVDRYAAAVAHAYWFLFDSTYDVSRNPYDPVFRGACDWYNRSLEGALRIARRNGQLRPGMKYRIETGKQLFEVEVVSRGTWHNDEFESFEFVSEYEITGLANRHHTYGLGVPLIAVRHPHEQMEPAENYYPPGLSFAVTAFLRVTDSFQDRKGEGHIHHCVLELYDPLDSKSIDVAGRRVPLETDLTTPLAYFLDNPKFEQQKNVATLAFLMPGSAQALQGIFMVQPYDPRKIPVLMVHGLWSSPITWMEMFNDLRSFPEIRERYQFWFYLYPTGQPFWISAAQLRNDLEQLRRHIDPEHQTPALDQMVLVGHSMGGLVSKLQTIDSREDYWRLLTDRPFDELKADAETRDKLSRAVFFRPNPSIRRVVTIATPHRGSDFANDYTRFLGRKLITLPEMLVRATQGLTRNNPGYFKNTELLTISTSIDSLSPDSPVLPLMLQSSTAPWTKYHNIVGLVSDDVFVSSLAAESDGVVSFQSAHLDNVASEIVVPADHSMVHSHPRSILEVRRILLDHQDQVLAELGATSMMLPAVYESPDGVTPPVP